MTLLIQNSNGGANLGDVAYYPQQGTTFANSSNQIWMRSGVLSPAGSYPTAEVNPILQISGSPVLNIMPSSPGASYTQYTSKATNGTGTVVVLNEISGYVNTSIDDGVTWTEEAVAFAGGLTPAAVCWCNGKFFLVAPASSNTALAFAASPDGITWTVQTTSAAIAPSGSNLSPQLATNGTMVVAVCNTSSTIITTTDGITLTTYSLASALSWPSVACIPALGATQWLISSAGSWWQSSLANASTWTSYAGPATTVAGKNSFSLVAASGIFAFLDTANYLLWHSTTGASGSWSSSLLSPEISQYLDSNGTNIVMSGYGNIFGVTTDGIHIKVRSYITNYNIGPTYPWIALVLNNNLFFGITTGNSLYYNISKNWASSWDYTGRILASTIAPTTGPTLYQYTRMQ